jgi:hypothetical protein
MRAVLNALGLVLVLSDPCAAQFFAPLPQPIKAAEVRREDFRKAFVRQLSQAEKSQLAGSSLPATTLASKRDGFCAQFTDENQACLSALAQADVAPFASSHVPRITAQPLSFGLPFTHSRDALSDYMRKSNTSEGLSVFSQFAANISDEEAFIVTNVVRGLTGRAIFSADYAAVVTKSDEADAAKRDVVESDKSTLIRMVNNGGTLVGRFYGPMFAESGTTISSTGGLSLGAGVIGPIGETDKLHSVGSIVGELAGSVAIRDLAGTAQQTAALLLGVRGGYARSDARLIADNSDKGIGFAQFAIGLRKNGEMSLSILITQTKKNFSDLLPKLQVNFAAIR